MRDCNRAVKKIIPTPVATDHLDNDNAPGVTQISDDSSVDSLLFVVTQNLREVFGTTPTTMMSHLPLREVIKMLFHPITKGLGHQWLDHPLIVAMRELIHFQITFPIQIPLMRELVVNVVKQNSILQPFGNAVLMANLNAFH